MQIVNVIRKPFRSLGVRTGRFMRCLAVTLCLLCVPRQQAEAQWFVTDLSSIASSILNSLDNLSALAEQFDQFAGYAEKFQQFKGWIDTNLGEGSTFDNIRDLMQNTGYLMRLVQQINIQLKLAVVYADFVVKMEEVGFNPHYIQMLYDQIMYTAQLVGEAIDVLKALFLESGIPKEEKIKEAQRVADRISLDCENSRMAFKEKLIVMEESRMLLAATNFLDGKPSNYGLDCMGVASGDSFLEGGGDYTYEMKELEQLDDVTLEEATENAGEIKQVGGTMIRFVFLIVGLLCIVALAFAYHRFVSGVPGADKLFIRIVVLVFAVVIIGVVLSSVFSLNF
jgi:hypothetical protein